MEKDIEKRLEALRSRFIKKYPQEDENIDTQVANFVNMSDQQREEKIVDLMALLSKKRALFKEKYILSADEKEKIELKEDIKVISDKLEQMESNLSLVRSGEFDATKIDKMKRQLINLELKRCKASLDGKDCSRIDQKIAEKKAQFFKEEQNE